MKLGLKIIIAVLVVIALAIGIFAVFFPNNFKTLWYYFRYSPEKSQDLIEETDQAYSDVLDMVSNDRYTLTDDDKDLINSGVLTEDEIVELLMSGKRPDRLNPDTSGIEDASTTPSDKADKETAAIAENKNVTGKVNTPEKKTQTATQTENKENAEEPSKEEDANSSETQTDYEIARIVARMYTLKSKYMNALDSMEDKIFSDYKALSKSDRTPENRKKISLKYLNEMSSLEKDCDKMISEALAELTDILKSSGRSIDMVDTLQKAYNDEKSLKKAYYLDIYTNGLRKDDKNAETTI